MEIKALLLNRQVEITISKSKNPKKQLLIALVFNKRVSIPRSASREIHWPQGPSLVDVNPPQFTNDRSKITDPAGGAVFVVRFAPQTDGLITGISSIRERERERARLVFEHFNKRASPVYLSI